MVARLNTGEPLVRNRIGLVEFEQALLRLTEAMRRLLTDAALAQPFTWERAARETVAVYQQVCG